MAWCRCWPRYLSPYDVTRPQWVNEFMFSIIYVQLSFLAGSVRGWCWAWNSIGLQTQRNHGPPSRWRWRRPTRPCCHSIQLHGCSTPSCGSCRTTGATLHWLAWWKATSSNQREVRLGSLLWLRSNLYNPWLLDWHCGNHMIAVCAPVQG